MKTREGGAFGFVSIETEDGFSVKISLTDLGFSFAGGPCTGKMFVNERLATWVADRARKESVKWGAIADSVARIKDPEVRERLEHFHSTYP